MHKKKLTAAYQKFIYKVLVLGVKVMLIKGIEPYKRAFVCKAITIGYFRVPQFRSIFLVQVQNKTYPEDEDAKVQDVD